MSELLITKCVSQKKMHGAGSPIASRNFLANSFGLLDSIWMSHESCIFVRSNLSLSAPNPGILCTPDRATPPFLSGHLYAGEVGATSRI